MEESFEQLYEYAYTCFQNGHYEKSLSLFRYLTLVQPHEFRHWLGLGSALLLMELYEEAVNIFTVAIAKNSADVRPYIYSAECYLKMKSTAQAQKLLHTIELLFPIEERTKYKNEIQLIKMQVKACELNHP